MEKATMIQGRRTSVQDHDLLGDKLGVSHEEAAQLGTLTPEELVVEQKLKRKIDTLIMPMVVLVYLMNYIDRSVFTIWNRCVYSLL